MRSLVTSLFCGAVGCMTLSSVATAQVVVFDNSDGQFIWEEIIDGKDFGGPFFGSFYLDITQGPEQVDDPPAFGTAPSHALRLDHSTDLGEPYFGQYRIVGLSDSRVAVGPTKLIDDPEGEPHPFVFVEEFMPGDTVDAAADFGNLSGAIRVYNWQTSPSINMNVPSDGGFAGVRIILNGHVHYGWIEFTDAGGLGPNQPIRWAYETEPDKPIMIPIPGDLTGDGTVGIADLFILLDAWGPCRPSGDCPADLNGDGVVDVFDLLILLAAWG